MTSTFRTNLTVTSGTKLQNNFHPNEVENVSWNKSYKLKENEKTIQTNNEVVFAGVVLI
jgi:hypothetical protein